MYREENSFIHLATQPNWYFTHTTDCSCQPMVISSGSFLWMPLASYKAIWSHMKPYEAFGFTWTALKVQNELVIKSHCFLLPCSSSGQTAALMSPECILAWTVLEEQNSAKQLGLLLGLMLDEQQGNNQKCMEQKGKRSVSSDFCSC